MIFFLLSRTRKLPPHPHFYFLNSFNIDFFTVKVFETSFAYMEFQTTQTRGLQKTATANEDKSIPLFGNMYYSNSLRLHPEVPDGSETASKPFSPSLPV